MTTPRFDVVHTGLLVPLDGCHNFRRVAGWQASAGRKVKSGVLYRSDGLGGLSDSDHATIAPLGLTHVLDLRASPEITSAPSCWPDSWQLDIWEGAESAAEADLTRLMARDGLSAADFREAMRAVYGRFHDDLAEATSAAARSLAESDGSVLVHCTAGKDRTGFVTAMLLVAIGVRGEEVLADFLLSNASLAKARIKFNQGGRLDAIESRSPGALDALVGVHPEYLAAAMAPMVKQHGSVDNWLAQRAGIDGPMRTCLKERLLD